jgi:hypothetical protein
MPNWNELLSEIQKVEGPLDSIRRKYIRKLYEYRGRNIITYYSGFLQKPQIYSGIMDSDKEMFMTAVHRLDKSKGLDLIINTPGGDIAATESIVDYLYKMFDKDIVIFVPQIAMSAGTLMACAAKEIYMGLESNLGPIDPQLNGISAKLVLAEFSEAKSELSNPSNPNFLYWKLRLEKFPPTFPDLCQKAITWSETLAKKWLVENMLSTSDKKEQIADDIVRKISDPDTTYSHGRHMHLDQLESYGLKINRLEKDNDLQDLVLTVHHAYMHTFQNSSATKIVENHNGIATVLHLNTK